ncbi:MAG: hypothetical protein JEZ11_28225 [Desulfobacterales bacterium]|nr:hypothetical protein [Desulfobacterales bacterium]
MKKILTTILLVCLLPCIAMADSVALDVDQYKSGGNIATQSVCSLTAVSASGSYTSSTYDLSQIEGAGGIQMLVQGDGTAKVEIYCSSDGTTFREPESADDVLTGITKTSGGEADGNVYGEFTWPVSKYAQVVITETGGSNPITATATLSYR